MKYRLQIHGKTFGGDTKEEVVDTLKAYILKQCQRVIDDNAQSFELFFRTKYGEEVAAIYTRDLWWIDYGDGTPCMEGIGETAFVNSIALLIKRVVTIEAVPDTLFERDGYRWIYKVQKETQ